MGCPAQIFLQHMFVRGSEPGAEEGYVKTGERLNENGGLRIRIETSTYYRW
jgi:hypothetical protein